MLSWLFYHDPLAFSNAIRTTLVGWLYLSLFVNEIQCRLETRWNMITPDARLRLMHLSCVQTIVDFSGVLPQITCVPSASRKRYWINNKSKLLYHPSSAAALPPLLKLSKKLHQLSKLIPTILPFWLLKQPLLYLQMIMTKRSQNRVQLDVRLAVSALA